MSDLHQVLSKVWSCCVFDGDDGQVGVTREPHISEELFDEICRVLKAHSLSEWEDISTAPKDGTPILGWAQDEEPGWEIMTVKWVEAQEDSDSRYVMHAAGWSGRILYPGGTMDDSYTPATFNISHWMYRPEAPKDE